MEKNLHGLLTVEQELVILFLIRSFAGFFATELGHCYLGNGTLTQEDSPWASNIPPPHVHFFGRVTLFSLAWVAALVQAGCSPKQPATASASSLHGKAAASEGPIVRVFRIPPIFVEESPRLVYDATVKNDTPRAVRFTGVQRSCSCTAAELGTKELAPGQETTLHFDIDLRHRKGPQRFVCRLLEQEGSEWSYALETTLYERASFTDTTYFGMVDPNTEETRETALRLYAESLASLPKDVSFKADSDRVWAEPRPGEVEIKPDGIAVRTIPLKLHLRAPAFPGPGSAPVYAIVEQQDQSRKLQTGVTWNVRTLYSVSPSQIYFGKVAPTDSPVQRWVRIRRTDGQPLVIKGVRVSCPGIRHEIEKTSELSQCLLAVTLDPKVVTKALIGQVVIETDHPKQPSVGISLAAISKPSK